MEEETKRTWERPWTTDEIRAQSANWNLAGDAGLLNHLQEFSQNLLSRTHATEVALDKLMEDMKTTSINVQNVTNKFLSLANTQFVENRVYDDDEKETPVEEKKKDLKKTKSKEEKEEEAFENVKQALQMGMSFLDTYFETVEVSASDSEEEESSMNMSRLILKPRNPYISRPLPYLIGSQEFMEDENVGLGDVQSDTEENPDQNIVHSSESEEDIAHDNLIVSSKLQISSSSDLENSEPESDRSESVVKQRRTKQSSSVGIVGQQVDEERDMFGQESPPEADVMSGGMRSSFSDELASKLGANKTQISPQKTDNLFGPSSETEDDGLFGKSSHPYSEKRGLFDDINNWQNTTDSLWNNKRDSKDVTDSDSSKQLRKDELFGPDDPEVGNDDIFTPSHSVDDKPINKTPQEVTASTPKDETGVQKRNDSFSKHSVTEDLLNKRIKDTTSSLFDKDDTEDDLFATPAVATVSRQSSTDLDSTKRKKLPGAVRVIDDVNLFGNISPVFQAGSSVLDRSSLIGRSIPQQEVSSGIGRTIAQKEVENDSQEQVENRNEKSLTFDSSLFQGTSTKVDNDVMSKSLFNEEHQSDSLFDKPRNHDLLRPNIAGNVSEPKLFPSLKSKGKKSVSIFEDSDSGEDELLFSSTSSTSSRSRRSQGSGDLLNHGGEKTLFKKGLFDDCFLDTESKEEPDVDIFKPRTETNSESESLKKKSIEEKKDNFNASSKIVSSIFDDIDDDEDDIFAVPKSKEESFVYKNNFLQEKSLLFTDGPTNVNTQHSLSNHSLLKSGVSGVTDDFLEENVRENVDNVKPSEKQSPKLNDSLNTSRVLEKEIETKAVENDSQEKSAPSSNVQYTPDIVADCSKVETSSGEVRKANNPVLNVKAEPPRSLNIRKTTNITTISSSNDDEDDDLFENITTNKSPPERVLSDKVIARSSSFGKLLEGFRSSSENNSPEIAETLGEKGNRIPDHQSNLQYATNIPVKVPSPATSSRPTSTSPKKLFIDPRALLPGATPPPVTVSADSGVGFDKPAVTSSILHSAGKERVKIQAKRRPPTRKARQEALKAAYNDSNSLDSSISSRITVENKVLEDQLPSSIVNNSQQNTVVSSPSVAEKDKEDKVDVNSAINFLSEETSEPSQVTGISDDYRNISEGVSGSSNPMSPLTDEEDLFAVPQEFPGDEGNSKEIIGSPKNLFGGAPVLSPLNDLLQSDREDSSVSPFKNIGQADDFLSGELGANNQSATKDVEKSAHSLGSSHTTGNSEAIIRDKPIENASLFQVSTRSKMFGGDLESEGGLFEKVSGHKNLNENNEDDDSLFSTAKKNESRRGSEQEKGLRTKMKAEQGGIFSSLDSPTKSLFSSTSEPSKNYEPSKPSYFSREGGNVIDPIPKLPLTNDTMNDNFLKQGSSVLNVEGDDLFSQGGKVKITGDSSSSASLEKAKSHISSLFGDDSTDTDDLFGSSSITAGKKHTTSSNSSMLSDSKVKSATESLFDDCDDDDIFAFGSSKRQGKSASLFPEVNRPDHRETDQTLFPKKNASTKPQISKQAVQKMKPKSDSFEDPLMVIKK